MNKFSLSCFCFQDLPKIEKELKKLLCEYETANGSPFLFDGVSFLELMEDQWKENSACKEAQKIARVGI